MNIFDQELLNQNLTENDYFKRENKRIILAPVQIIAALTIIAGIYALLFELQYYQDFKISIYWGRLSSTLIGFFVFSATFLDFGKKHAELLIHILLLSIIVSFGSIIIQIPNTLFINSQILSLLIFTSALFLSWDLKNQIIVAIYYNLFFTASILISDNSIYFMPNLFGTVIFVIFVSVMSIVANAVNFNLRRRVIQKTLYAKDIFLNSSEALFRMNYDGEFIAYNKSFKRLLNLENSKKNNLKYLRKIFRENEKISDFIALEEEEATLENLDLKFNRDENDLLHIKLKLRKRIDNNNKCYFDGSLIDVTEQYKASEKKRIYLEKLEEINNSKDKFFSIISHDLKSPFTALLGYSDFLVRDALTLDREEILNFSKIINDVTKNAYHLVENLLNWSRIQTNRMKYEPEKILLASVINDLLMVFKTKASLKSLEMTNKVKNDIMVYCDGKMLQLILHNLLSNAIIFNKDNGTINICSVLLENEVQIEIEDSGIGLSQENIDNLFNIDIHKTKIGKGNENGSGIGLIITKDLIEKNGGNISVESQIDVGSKFKFTLPLYLEEK